MNSEGTTKSIWDSCCPSFTYTPPLRPHSFLIRSADLRWRSDIGALSPAASASARRFAAVMTAAYHTCPRSRAAALACLVKGQIRTLRSVKTHHLLTRRLYTP